MCGIPSCRRVQQGASGPRQDTQPGKQAPQVLCSLIFTVGLHPLMLGLSLERAQDDLASLLQTSCLGSPSGHCPSAPCPATPLPPEWRHVSIAIFPALSAPHGADLLAESYRHPWLPYPNALLRPFSAQVPLQRPFLHCLLLQDHVVFQGGPHM